MPSFCLRLLIYELDRTVFIVLDGVIADMFFKNQSTVLFPIGADISMCLVVLKLLFFKLFKKLHRK